MSNPLQQTIEALAKELASKLRSMHNHDELTDYAVSLLRESNEEAGQEDQARRTIAKASRGDPFNPIAFGIPLFVIGAVLCAIGLVSLAHSAFFGISAYLLAGLSNRFALVNPLLTLPLWIPFIVAGGQAVQVAMGASGTYDQALALLIDFDILFVVLTSLAARFVLDE